MSGAVIIPETIRLEIGGAKLEVRYERVAGWQEAERAHANAVAKLRAQLAIAEGERDRLQGELKTVQEAVMRGWNDAEAASLEATNAASASKIATLEDRARECAELWGKVRAVVTDAIGGQPASRTGLECVVALAHELNVTVKRVEEQGRQLIAAGIGVR